MDSCIYCRKATPEVSFDKVEHVMPQSFGRFRDNLTLVGIVCEPCNEFFGKEQRLDAELHYWLSGRKLRLSAAATNLTNEPQVSYQGYRRFVEDASFSGRKFQFSVQWAFR